MLIKPSNYISGAQHIDSFITTGYTQYNEVAIEGDLRAERVVTNCGDIDNQIETLASQVRTLEYKIASLNSTIDEFVQHEKLISKYPELAQRHLEFIKALKKCQTAENITKEHSING